MTFWVATDAFSDPRIIRYFTNSSISKANGIKRANRAAFLRSMHIIKIGKIQRNYGHGWCMEHEHSVWQCMDSPKSSILFNF